MEFPARLADARGRNSVGNSEMLGVNTKHCRSQDSAIGIASGYGLKARRVGVRVAVGARFFSTPQRPDPLWGPPSHLYNGYRVFFPRG
jgi:hypothetical protein